MIALRITDRVHELAAEAVDPDRPSLTRAMAAEELHHRLRRDNPTAFPDEIECAAADALTTARKARQ